MNWKYCFRANFCQVVFNFLIKILKKSKFLWSNLKEIKFHIFLVQFLIDTFRTSIFNIYFANYNSKLFYLVFLNLQNHYDNIFFLIWVLPGLASIQIPAATHQLLFLAARFLVASLAALILSGATRPILLGSSVKMTKINRFEQSASILNNNQVINKELLLI